MGFRDWVKSSILCEKIGWENLPKGWTKKSVEKFMKSLTGSSKDDPEGMFTECVKRIKDEADFDEESAKKFCASAKDLVMGDPYWRGDNKKKGD